MPKQSLLYMGRVLSSSHMNPMIHLCRELCGQICGATIKVRSPSRSLRYTDLRSLPISPRSRTPKTAARSTNNTRRP